MLRAYELYHSERSISFLSIKSESIRRERATKCTSFAELEVYDESGRNIARELSPMRYRSDALAHTTVQGSR